MKWTEELTTQAVTMRKRGFSSAMIAKTLGCTRNMVVGKLYRLGVSIGGPVVHRATYVRKNVDRSDIRSWSEENLTETWEARKARLARERAA